MPQTTTKRSPAKQAAKAGAPPARSAGGIDRTKELSEEVLESVEKAQRAAIDAVRKFLDTVDEALPALPREGGASRRGQIVDSALVMADRLVHTQYDFLHKVIESAGQALAKTDGVKTDAAQSDTAKPNGAKPKAAK